MEVLVVLVIAFVAGACAIVLGMLAAPAVGRLADRAGGADQDDGEESDER